MFDEKRSVTDAIADRDCLGLLLKAYHEIYDSAAIKRENSRYSRNEIKFIRNIDSKKLQDRINILSKEYRELDTKLQSINWTIDLI